MSGSGFDGFGDVIQNEEGIFSGSLGLRTYDSVKHSMVPEGLNTEVQCERCGNTRHLLVTWPELAALRFDVSPHEAYRNMQNMMQYASPWQLPSQQAMQRGVKRAWFPANIQCRCGAPFYRPHITPQECEGHLQSGLQNGFIQPHAARQLAQHCHGVAQQLGRAR